MAFNRFIDKAKDAASHARDIGQETADRVRETAGQWLEISKEKLNLSMEQMLGEMVGLKPILLECGFIVGDINVTLGLPPEIKMTVDQTGQGHLSLQSILEKDDGQLTALQKTVLRSMVRANDMAEVTKNYGYTFRKYDVELTLPPRVTVHLISNKSSG